MPAARSSLDSFMTAFRVESTGCWEWTRYIKPNGYGHFMLSRTENDGKAIPAYAHRFSYEHFKGPIPDGLVIDHLCRNPACVNPDHLEAVTQKENVRRGTRPQRSKTHCPRGHLYTVKSSAGFNICRPCIREQAFIRTCAKAGRAPIRRDPGWRKGEGNPNVRFSADDIREIHRANRRGEQHTRIAKRFHIALPYIRKVLLGGVWPDIALEFADQPIRRSMATHCAHGHAFTADNTVLRHKDGYTYRACRICTRERSRRSSQKRRKAA